MAFRSFQSRVVVSFLLLISLVQIGTFIAVDAAIERSARTHVTADLETAARVVGRLIEVRTQRLVEAARILSSDFAFKQVIALSDRDTLRSAMDNHRTRIGAELMLLVSLDGARYVDTLPRAAVPDPPGPPPAVARLVEAAQRGVEVSDFALFDGRPYQVVVVPLMAPARIAWIGMGFSIDQAFADALRTTTAADVSFVHADADGRWTIVTSTAAPAVQHALVSALPSAPSAGVFELPRSDLETLLVPLPSATGVRLSLALQRRLADAMQPYRFLRTVLVVLFGAGAVVSIAGGLWIARGVSRPVRQLAHAARRLEAGHYDGQVRMARADEIGDLAATFDRMTGAVAEREERLRESEERFRAMTESAVDAVVTADAEGRIVTWNGGAERIFGYTRDEALGLPLTRLIPDAGAAQETVERRGIARDGRPIPVELSLARWQTRDGSFRTAIIRDVSERRELEERFRQAQKMESIGRLAGGVAHDFNNVLTVITGHIGLLRDELARDHPAQRRIETIDTAAAHAADLTRQLLAFSRKQVLAPKVLDVNDVLARVEPMLRRLIGEDVELVVARAPDLGRVEADPSQLTQIVVNLAVNARDAMPGGGTLTIETANVELGDAHADRHAETRPGRYVMLAVSDTGIGMDEETRSHVFEPFFTTKGPGEGTGLGLATVYGIVKQSNGAVGVYSEPGHGTTFRIYLPRVEKAPAAPVAVRPGRALAGAETVLLVEDNAMVRALTCEVLQSHGYTVLEARNGVDALDITQRYHGVIHVLVTDVVMPEMGGRELAARLAAARPTLKVVYMSGYSAEAIAHHGVLGEHEAFLSKPHEPKDLLQKVRDILDGPRDS